MAAWRKSTIDEIWEEICQVFHNEQGFSFYSRALIQNFIEKGKKVLQNKKLYN